MTQADDHGTLPAHAERMVARVESLHARSDHGTTTVHVDTTLSWKLLHNPSALVHDAPHGGVAGVLGEFRGTASH